MAKYVLSLLPTCGRRVAGVVGGVVCHVVTHVFPVAERRVAGAVGGERRVPPTQRAADACRGERVSAGRRQESRHRHHEQRQDRRQIRSVTSCVLRIVETFSV